MNLHPCISQYLNPIWDILDPQNFELTSRIELTRVALTCGTHCICWKKYVCRILTQFKGWCSPFAWGAQFLALSSSFGVIRPSVRPTMPKCKSLIFPFSSSVPSSARSSWSPHKKEGDGWSESERAPFFCQAQLRAFPLRFSPKLWLHRWAYYGRSHCTNHILFHCRHSGFLWSLQMYLSLCTCNW